jgi:hypothetical protein
VRAVTWLHNDQLHDDQRPEPEGKPGDRLGEGLLLPAPLRRVSIRRTLDEPPASGWRSTVGSARLASPSKNSGREFLG